MAGTKIGDWALSYEFPQPSGPDIGLYALRWKKFLDSLRRKETITINCRIPFAEKQQFKFGSTVLIQHTPFLVARKSQNIPYNGTVQLELVRI